MWKWDEIGEVLRDGTGRAREGGQREGRGKVGESDRERSASEERQEGSTEAQGREGAVGDYGKERGEGRAKGKDRGNLQGNKEPSKERGKARRGVLDSEGGKAGMSAQSACVQPAAGGLRRGNGEREKGWGGGVSRRQGEKLSADVEAANVYKAEFAEMVATKKLERSQVFNMDESGLVYKSTPKRTFVAADQAQAAGGKKQLERVTIVTCSNADGSFMLPLILIGKSKNPRCLRNVNKDELLVWYRSQTNAWINKEIFEEWFTDVFVPKIESFLNSKNLPKTAVVLVDNCRSHRCVKINDIEVNFFPPNVTSLIQPMDQGIIQTVKLHYEINLVNAIVEAQNENMTLIEFLKTIDVHKVIFWIADAWKKVKPTTMQKCWKNLWPKKNQRCVDSNGRGLFYYR
ncbi:jerky protein homolog-like [Neodiprion fabricii]|uniref:jerky protein homolog-like n=1 Tax=Neodiprion fabricii TaxID=2872261 RepID=UPI001ED97824|nr:jerky protein homolog-like [Neodiprion fabricii]